MFASVGTDYHPFDRLSRWIDSWLEAGGSESARCFVQTGTSAVPRLAEHRQYLGHAEMEAMVREAAVVVCHGGPGTIMLASTLGKRPIVVLGHQVLSVLRHACFADGNIGVEAPKLLR